MKTVSFIIPLILLFACAKDLERDNPYDKKYSGSDKIETREIMFFNYSVACKIISGNPPNVKYGVEEEIRAGDHIWLQVKIQNVGDYQIDKIRCLITSESQLIQLIDLNDNYYITFQYSSPPPESIPVGRIGYGEVKSDSKYFHFAPNNNSYITEFIVDSNAQLGTIIPFKMVVTDNLSNEWNIDFEIHVE